jgi:hypothetical protein
MGIGDVEAVNLEEPVVIELLVGDADISEESGNNISCVFWDFDANEKGGDWSAAGCRLSKVIGDMVVCSCDHLTNFAILVGVNCKSCKALEIITLIGCLLSIVCLTVTLVVYQSSRKLRHGRSRQIFMHFCLSWLVFYIVFLIASLNTVKNLGGGCVFLAALLHYVILATMMWTAVEARNMYASAVKVFPEDSSRYMLKACLIAWGSPLLVLIITLAVASDHYRNENYCFLKTDLVMYIALFVPLGVILLHNLVIFVLVMRSLLRVAEASRAQQISKRLQNAVGISVLLGLTWVFGFLAISEVGPQQSVFFSSCFCVTTALQVYPYIECCLP